MRSTGVYRTAFFEKIVDDFAVIEIYPIIAANLQCEPENVRTSQRSPNIGPNSRAMAESAGRDYNQNTLMGDDTSSPGGSKWA